MSNECLGERKSIRIGFDFIPSKERIQTPYFSEKKKPIKANFLKKIIVCVSVAIVINFLGSQ
jgi:hypothetical protein